MVGGEAKQQAVQLCRRGPLLEGRRQGRVAGEQIQEGGRRQH